MQNRVKKETKWASGTVRFRWGMACAALLLFAALAAVNWYAARGEYEDLFFLFAKQTGSEEGLSVKKLEELNGDALLLTYEIRRNKVIGAIHAHYDVMLTGTNHTYPFVTGHQPVAGSFFTKAAQEQKSRVAVLNKTAAAAIFGGTNVAGTEIEIDGAVYTVTGVVEDGDEKNKNVYAPAETLTEASGGMQAGWPDGSLPARADTDSPVDAALAKTTASDESIKNIFQNAGMMEEGNALVSLGALRRSIHERALFAAGLALFVMLAEILQISARQAVRAARRIKEQLASLYLAQLAKAEPRAVWRLAASGAGILLSIGGLFFLAGKLFATALSWKQYAGIWPEARGMAFEAKIESLRQLILYADICFGLFAAVAGAWLISGAVIQKWRSRRL